MKSLEQWLQEYGESHQNRRNQILHKICVPAIFFSVLAMLWVCRIEGVALFFPVAILALIFYFRLGWKAGVLMLVQISLSAVALHLWENSGAPILWPAIILFVVAWVGQFVGHHIEGRRPSFFKDLQFLLIGPLWVFASWL